MPPAPVSPSVATRSLQVERGQLHDEREQVEQDLADLRKWLDMLRLFLLQVRLLRGWVSQTPWVGEAIGVGFVSRGVSDIRRPIRVLRRRLFFQRRLLNHRLREIAVRQEAIRVALSPEHWD